MSCGRRVEVSFHSESQRRAPQTHVDVVLSDDVEGLRSPLVELTLGHLVVGSTLGTSLVVGAVGSEVVGALRVSSSDVSRVAVERRGSAVARERRRRSSLVQPPSGVLADPGLAVVLADLGSVDLVKSNSRLGSLVVSLGLGEEGGALVIGRRGGGRGSSRGRGRGRSGLRRRARRRSGGLHGLLLLSSGGDAKVPVASVGGGRSRSSLLG